MKLQKFSKVVVLIGAVILISSCKKDEETQMSNRNCLKVSEENITDTISYSYEYNSESKLKSSSYTQRGMTYKSLDYVYGSKETTVTYYNKDGSVLGIVRYLIGANGYAEASIGTFNFGGKTVVDTTSYSYDSNGYNIESTRKAYDNYSSSTLRLASSSKSDYEYLNGNLVKITNQSLQSTSAIPTITELEYYVDKLFKEYPSDLNLTGKANKNLLKKSTSNYNSVNGPEVSTYSYEYTLDKDGNVTKRKSTYVSKTGATPKMNEYVSSFTCD